MQKAELEALLLDGRWFLPMPLSLRPAYEARRAADFARMIVVAWPLLVLAYLLASLLTYGLYHQVIHGADQHIAWLGSAFVGCVMLVCLSLALRPGLRRSFLRWQAIPVGLVLLTKVALGLFFQSPLLARNDVILTLLIMAICTLAMPKPIVVSALACLLGACGFALLPWASNTYFAGLFMAYYAAGTTVFLGLAWMQENRNRQVFLQALLLASQNEEIQQLNAGLALLAREDTVSGVANRRHFDEVLAQEWERARREQRPLALLFLDVDHFKQFNDLHGHPAGDDCLRQVGAILSSFMRRPGDLAARYGGEEFTVLLPGTDAEGAWEIATQLLASIDALQIPHRASPTAAHVTISIGVTSCIPDAAQTAQAIVNKGDNAMYEDGHVSRLKTHSALPCQAHSLYSSQR